MLVRRCDTVILHDDMIQLTASAIPLKKRDYRHIKLKIFWSSWQLL